MSNQHYPYSSRANGLRWPISATELVFPSYNGTKVRPILTITSLTDLIDSVIAPIIPVGDMPGQYAYQYDPKVTTVSGWTVTNSSLDLLRYTHYLQTSAFPVNLVPNTRPQRRVNKHHFAITAKIRMVTIASSGGNSCRFTLSGYWGINDPSDEGPNLVDYTETCPLPTLFSCCQDIKQINSVTYAGSTFTVTENTILKIGSVPTVIEDHITDLRDEVLGVCQTTDVSAEFWLVALPAALPRDLHNRSLANSSYFLPIPF